LSEETKKQEIAERLRTLANAPLLDGAAALWRAMGYTSERTFRLDGTDAEAFRKFTEDSPTPFRSERAHIDRWAGIAGLFQLQDADLNAAVGNLFADPTALDTSLVKSYLFFALDVAGAKPLTRTELSHICREINRPFPMPVLLLIRQSRGDDATLTLAVQDRRPNKQDTTRDVLEKVTLIKDIRLTKPHRAHIEILHDLCLNQVADQHRPANFDELHKAWSRVLDANALNKRFYQELANWYFWARTKVTFPGVSDESDRSQAVIRLITRLIFVWFLREKGLVPEELFRPRDLRELVKDFDKKNASTYYRAILQNLFFATLNAEMDDPKRPRRFRTDHTFQGANADQGVTDVWRYKALLPDPAKAEALFNQIPFLNGGLFECLPDQDGFSDHEKRAAVVPNELFFSPKRECTDCDLNAVYGTKNKRYYVEGLIDLLEQYKFTIDENTPIEEEVALDPELLGRVFENLLASYNPETSSTARKQTGSFYTPREIVDYMVDEALIAYLEAQTDTDTEKLRRLLSYDEEEPAKYLTEAQISGIVKAIDRVKVLDPACGSGAFPMGALQKLVHVLRKLDPQNTRWKASQVEAAEAIPDSYARNLAKDAIEKAFANNNEADYGRKLYLIEECIYGTDIQPIAAQISKLRFFISLIIDQKAEVGRPNRGILALPNLETNFVVANALGASPVQGRLFSDEVYTLRKALKAVRRAYFEARGTDTKKKRVAEDEALREKLRAAFLADGMELKAANDLADWNPYQSQIAADFFDPEWMFGSSGGFDIVVANPPYIRQEDIKEQKTALKEAFPEIYTGTADLYTYFYGLAVRLLKPSGTLSFISSNKWFRAGYGEKLRGYIAVNCQVENIIDFGNLQVFENAIAYPLVFIASKGKPKYAPRFTRVLTLDPPYPDIHALTEQRGFQLPEKALNGAEWNIADATTTDRTATMRKSGLTLADYLRRLNSQIYRGLLTGFNTAFVLDDAKRDELVAKDPKSTEIIKPLAVGRDIKRWVTNSRNQWLIVTKIGVDSTQYPAIMEHLNQWEKELRARQDQGQHYWELRACAYYEEFDKPKILYQEIATFQAFSLDRSGLFVNNKVFLIPTDDMYLLGILNSRPAWDFLSEVCTKMVGGAFAMQRPFVEQLPIPNATSAQKTAIATLAEYLTFLHSSDGSDTTGDTRDGLMRDYFEQILNALAHELYFSDERSTPSVFTLFGDAPGIKTFSESERLPHLRSLFESLYEEHHPLRGILFRLKEPAL
jgi:adenine-specific DNA-methyltransferase